MTDLMDDVDSRLSDTDHGEGNIAHIIRKKDQMRGYYEGQKIKAMCGLEWVPVHDYQGKPVCKACIAAVERLLDG